ncbi:MAG: hypothetical protein U5K37_10510 [Natrialbaceae archaeon]|nr:hypothetical protein [Natrialbaceae archaeon]
MTLDVRVYSRVAVIAFKFVPLITSYLLNRRVEADSATRARQAAS